MLRHLAAAALVVLALLPSPSTARAEVSEEKSPQTKPPAALTIESLLEKINATYMSGMQRCYTNGLRRNPKLNGQVTMLLTVAADGRASGSAKGIAPAVDSCLTNRLSAWRFASPRDRNDRPTEQTFKLRLMLRQ